MASRSAENFKYVGDLTGSSVPFTRAFPIATATAIEKGEIVTLSAGKVVAVSDDTVAVLGVAAEPHDGSSEGQTGTEILVYCSPTAIFRCIPKLEITADASSTTNTIIEADLNALANDALNGGHVKVVSATTVAVGSVVEITDFVGATGTITAAGAFAEGDVLLILPPVGYQLFALDSDGTNIDMTDDTGTILTVVAVNSVAETVDVVLSEHIFASVKA